MTFSHKRAQPGPAARHPRLYSLMGSGLGAWEGSSARLSRLVSVVVSSLAVVTRSARTEQVRDTHPTAWAAPRDQRRMPLCPKGARGALGGLLCPKAVEGSAHMAAVGLGDALFPCKSLLHGVSFSWDHLLGSTFKGPEELWVASGGIGAIGKGLGEAQVLKGL